MTPKRFHLHLVSDATGETISAVARACLVQFDNIEPIPHLWWLIRTPGQVDQVIAGIEAEPGVVLASIIDGDIRADLETGCRRLHVPFIPALDPVIASLAGYLGAEVGHHPGRQHALDAEYFRRIDAMHFAVSHDDGQLLYGLNDADVILVGVSRTSKTPTAMYLANRGIKAANIPFVPGVPLPDDLFTVTHPMIIGLTKEPGSLSDIRRARLLYLDPQAQVKENWEYADPERVRDEVHAARRLFAHHQWPVIDVSHRSIEEASAAIIQLLATNRSNMPQP